MHMIVSLDQVLEVKSFFRQPLFKLFGLLYIKNMHLEVSHSAVQPLHFIPVTGSGSSM